MDIKQKVGFCIHHSPALGTQKDPDFLNLHSHRPLMNYPVVFLTSRDEFKNLRFFHCIIIIRILARNFEKFYFLGKWQSEDKNSIAYSSSSTSSFSTCF